jgi:predicted DNA-binding protein YlxM (UPF0122 family)
MSAIKKIKKIDSAGSGDPSHGLLPLDPNISDGIDLSHVLKLRLIKKLSFQEIGKMYGVSKQAISNKLKNFFDKLPDGNSLEAYKENRKELLSAIELKILSYIFDDEKLKSARLGELTVAYGVLFDKRRLEEGKSTSNIAYKEVTKEIEEIEKALREYKTGKTPETSQEKPSEGNTRDLISLDKDSNINGLERTGCNDTCNPVHP